MMAACARVGAKAPKAGGVGSLAATPGGSLEVVKRFSYGLVEAGGMHSRLCGRLQRSTRLRPRPAAAALGGWDWPACKKARNDAEKLPKDKVSRRPLRRFRGSIRHHLEVPKQWPTASSFSMAPIVSTEWEFVWPTMSFPNFPRAVPMWS